MLAKGYDFQMHSGHYLYTVKIGKIYNTVFGPHHFHINTADGVIDEHDSEYDALIKEREDLITEYSIIDEAMLVATLKAEANLGEEYQTNYNTNTMIIAGAATAASTAIGVLGAIALDNKFKLDKQYEENLKQYSELRSK